MSPHEHRSDHCSSRIDVFLLTKPAHNDRSRLCLNLVMQSENAVLYLAGDGVYNLLGGTIETLRVIQFLTKERIFAAKEDLESRGVSGDENATVIVDFYERLVDEIMQESNRIYAF